MNLQIYSQKKRVFVVDDHPMVRDWLAILINQQADMEVCGEGSSAEEGLQIIAAAKPHLAMVDISLEGGSGIELIRNIRALCPEVAVVVLSMHDEVFYVERALRAGARGYIMKREATKNVLQAIRAVLEGKIYLSKEIAGMMTDKFVAGHPHAKNSPVELLSDRELEVFQWLGRGRSTKQIAGEMQVSFRTVHSFCARIKEKLGLASAAELLRVAVRWHDSQNSG